MDDNRERGPSLPPVVVHELLRLAYIELHVIVFVPCDAEFYQYSVLIVVVVDVSNNGGVIRKLLELAGTRVEVKSEV